MKDYKTILAKLIESGTAENTAVDIVEKLKRGLFPSGLNVTQAIIVGWL